MLTPMRINGFFLLALLLHATFCTTLGFGAESASSDNDIASRLDTADGLKCTLFASEPDVINPSAIDVDHRGRVWACEIVNYRGRSAARPEGDRIVILQDNDGDGRADESKVFYQGTDINSPHGVCVLGNPDGRGTTAIISAGSRIVMLIDDDGDDRADRQENLFTGIEGVQHDHGIHAVVFGPDGRLYFNCGNEANVIHDAQGKPIRDLAGNLVNNKRNPYQQAMAFRCNLDGTQFETLGWNFRNPWMLTVDSFGNIWQSDNDDDGNRATRINFIAEFGNYGYTDELTGAGWRAWRTGQHSDLPYRHWHINDPGVMPTMLFTGSGSPAGITIYEGNLLTDHLPGRLLHCDPGHGVVRSYQTADHGAGYQAESTDLVVGSRAPWFRPVDVKVAPDGSLIIADWSDPAVGGHQVGDLRQGRIFRLTPANGKSNYAMPSFNFKTVEGAADALANPNFAVRAMAWKHLQAFGPEAGSFLGTMSETGDPVLRARAFWGLGAISDDPGKVVERAMASDDPQLRIVGLRLARQHQLDILSNVKMLLDDPTPAVQRELAIALAHDQSDRAARLWAHIASNYQGNDRWLLESLGIGARGKWDACLAHWQKMVGERWSTEPQTDIVWRSRATQTASLLTKMILSTSSHGENFDRYIRALDFQPPLERSAAFAALLKHDPLPSPEVVVEALQRKSEFRIDENPAISVAIETYLAEHQGSTRYHALIRRFGLTDHVQELRGQLGDTESPQSAIEAARTLLSLTGPDQLLSMVDSLSNKQRPAVIENLGHLNNPRINQKLREWMLNDSTQLSLRTAALGGLSKTHGGLLTLLEIVRQGELPERFKFGATQALYGHYDESIIRQARELLPPLNTTGAEELPPLFHLVHERGDVDSGKRVFDTTGTCAKCHRLNQAGKQVGPNLSEIGSKLSREALYQAILDPSAGISHNYEQYLVVLDSGIAARGLLISRTDDGVTLRNTEGVDTTFSMDEIVEITKSELSLMPAGVEKLLSKKQLVDLVEYLTTLKKQGAREDFK